MVMELSPFEPRLKLEKSTENELLSVFFNTLGANMFGKVVATQSFFVFSIPKPGEMIQF